MTDDNKIDKLDYIIKLAALEIKEEDKASLVEAINNVLVWSGELGKINTDNIEPLYNISQAIKSQPRRQDEVKLDYTAENILSNTEKTLDGYFLLPKFVN